ncbi:MAG: hypothetical protein LBP50_00640, partial [Tannerella sp.]|nr:hypothetical protein [Tannerella sp.]
MALFKPNYFLSRLNKQKAFAMVQNRRTNQDRQAVYDPSKRDRILLISTISPTSSQHYSTFKPGFNAAERRLRATATALGEKAGGASVIHYIYVLSHP